MEENDSRFSRDTVREATDEELGRRPPRSCHGRRFNRITAPGATKQNPLCETRTSLEGCKKHGARIYAREFLRARDVRSRKISSESPYAREPGCTVEQKTQLARRTDTACPFDRTRETVGYLLHLYFRRRKSLSLSLSASLFFFFSLLELGRSINWRR